MNSNADAVRNDQEDSGTPVKKGRRGVKGRQWTWGKLKGGARILSDEHLVIRYLVDEDGYDAAAIATMCGCDLAEARTMIYGRTRRRDARAHIATIARSIGVTADDLLERALAWRANEVVIVRVRSLDMTENYGFQRDWLERNGFDPENLVIVTQKTVLLASEGIQKGDTLLVNRGDTEFSIGAFYAVGELNEEVWLGMAVSRQGVRCLAADPSGNKISLEDFDAQLRNGKILGRCVWRGGLM